MQKFEFECILGGTSSGVLEPAHLSDNQSIADRALSASEKILPTRGSGFTLKLCGFARSRRCSFGAIHTYTFHTYTLRLDGRLEK